MNEREFMLRMVIALANRSGYNEFEAAKEFAAEARARGLFDEPAPSTNEARTQLASVVKESDQLGADLDAAKALLKEMAEYINDLSEPIGEIGLQTRTELLRRAKEDQ